MRVRLINDPVRTGILTGREQKRRNRRLLQVEFNDGIRWIPEDQLERIQSVRMSPLDMLEQRKLGRPSDLRRTLTHMKLSGRLADVIYSMEATNTDFYAYQFKSVVKILESPSNGILIADEVGLGKTIEAGLIWTELRSRFDMRRLLVLCPAALREKWKSELSEKMGVEAKICDARETLAILRSEDAHSRGFAVIASTQGLRPPRWWEEKEADSTGAKLARFLRSKESDSRLVDLLVIDEAHHLRNLETQTNELGLLCKNVAEYTIFLTATPIHNRNDDLFSLLQLLDPDTFTRRDVLSQILEANAPLVKARDLVLSAQPDVNKFRELLLQAQSHPLLRANRQLSMIEQEGLSQERFNRRDARSRLAYRLETVNLLAHVVTRTRKRDVQEWCVLREPIPEFVELEQVEERFYDLVTEVVVKYALQRQINERFLVIQPQRQMTSSMAASLRAWQKKLIELEEMEQTGLDEEDEQRRMTMGPLVTEIVRRSRDYVELDHLIQVDTKYSKLRDILSVFLNKHPQEKVVVFSTFHSTLGYLAERLEADGISCLVLKGGQRETKNETIKRFRDQAGARVLLSSEVGGEGVDLQFSRVLINYDLPWNPMRLEQRIGRIDRLGQEADKVTIWNIFYKNTIDSRIYERLYEKLDLCRNALGDFEAILGETVRKLEIDLLSGNLTSEQQEKRIDQTSQALENLRLEEQQLEQGASNLIAYGDYILNQIHAAREMNRWISGEDIQRYVFDYLRLNYPGSELRQIEQGKPFFQIDLSDQAKLDLADFIRNNRLPFVTRLTRANSLDYRFKFESRDAVTASPYEELISQFHPIVRMISSRIADKEEQLTPAVAIKLNNADMDVHVNHGIYIIAISLWAFHGLQDTEKLSYAARSLDHDDGFLDSDQAEKLVNIAVTKGKDWLEARNVVDIECVYQIANDVLLANLDDDYQNYMNELIAKNEDRADIQLQSLEQHLTLQKSRLEEVKQKHSFHGRTALVKATEGRIRALEKRVGQQRLRIKRSRSYKSDSREIAIAIIQLI
jgi:superfamily II DNA or RNA helicase